jgi:hypothetical protein
LEVIRQLLGLLRPPDPDERAGEARRGLFDRAAVDLHALADGWLDLVRPVWYEHLRDRRRTRPLRLRDLRPTLVGAYRLLTSQLKDLVAQTRPVRPVDERVVASVIGVADGATQS